MVAAPIPIYVDAICLVSQQADERLKRQHTASMSLLEKCDFVLKYLTVILGLSVRRQLDSDSDRITKNPLIRHQMIGGDAPSPAKMAATAVSQVTKPSESLKQVAAAPFAIFTDTDKPAAANAPRVTKPSESLKQVAAAPFAIFTDTDKPATVADVDNEIEKHDELEALLQEMVGLEADDGTINTRLARKDIDCMFFSPQNPVKTRSHTMDVCDTHSVANRVHHSDSGHPLKVLPQAAHRPFGIRAEPSDFSAVKDLSGIREVSLLLACVVDPSLFLNIDKP